MKRREAIKAVGLAAMGTALAPDFLLSEQPVSRARQRIEGSFTGKPVTCIILGAGNRGNTYAAWSRLHPDQMKVVGVAEPIPERQEKFARMYDIPEAHRFPSWDDALAVPKFADAILITTPDQLHFGPATQGIAMGYDVLLEKPIATSWKECVEIRDLNRKYNRVVAVCHVLRYTRYYRRLKQIVDSGILGEIATIEHLEPVNYWHQAHSFVRGNWRNVATSCPMILAKSCHDMDILRWIIDRPCETVSSFGSLKHFTERNAPAGSTARCTDGCAVEHDCPYSALKLYLDMDNKGWPVTVITEDVSHEGRMKALREGPYGRCVYRSDNDVVDHQVVTLEFANQITASFTMSAFTVGGRRTRVMGTMGEAIGDSRYIHVYDFRSGDRHGKETTIDTQVEEGGITSGHGGGDYNLMESFIKAVQHHDHAIVQSSLDVSVESHLMAFEAERSRLEKKTIQIAHV